MEIPGLLLSACALLASVCLIIVARQEGGAVRAALAHVLRVVGQANSNAERTRAQAESARAETIATRSEVQALRELLQEIRDDTPRPAGRAPAGRAKLDDNESGPA